MFRFVQGLPIRDVRAFYRKITASNHMIRGASQRDPCIGEAPGSLGPSQVFTMPQKPLTSKSFYKRLRSWSIFVFFAVPWALRDNLDLND